MSVFALGGLLGNTFAARGNHKIVVPNALGVKIGSKYFVAGKDLQARHKVSNDVQRKARSFIIREENG